LITIALFVDNSLLPAVIVLALIAIVAIIAGVILLILYIKLRAAYKRLSFIFVFYDLGFLLIMDVQFTCLQNQQQKRLW